MLVCTIAVSSAEPINISSKPFAFSNLDDAQVNFGKLRFTGGLVLRSSFSKFGGFSGVMLYEKGQRLLAVSDRGWWLSSIVDYENGVLSRLSNAQMGPLHNRAGKRYRRNRHRDAESVATFGSSLASGVMVGLERDTRVELYKFEKGGLTGRPRTILAPKGLERGPNNKELEAIGRFTSGPNAGKIIALSEANLDAMGNIVGYMWTNARKNPERFTIKRREKYHVTDLAVLRGGDIAILERQLGVFKIPSMAIRYIKAEAIAKGRILDGEVLLEASAPAYNVDNMEGLSAHRDEAGRLIFTLISDDNFNHTFQRTLLMQFVWENK